MPYLLAVTAARVSRVFAGAYEREFDLTIAQWRVIAHVARNASISVNVLSENTSMDKVKVSRAVTQLRERGLIRRVVDPRDARLVMIALTAAGRRTFEAIVPRGLALERELEGILGTSDYAELRRLLSTLRAGLDAGFERTER